jgi:hypothetical protein
LYVRHNAWLNATPEGKENTRRESYPEGSIQLELTTLSPYEQLVIEWWNEVGTVSQTAGGILPLEWVQIIKWADKFYTEEYVEWLEHPRPDKRFRLMSTPIVLKQWNILDCELILIRKLSQEYSAEYNAASESARPCPKLIDIEDVDEDVAAANALAMKEAFNMFKK